MRPWHTQARPEQLPPADGDWRVYQMRVGRGWGKTRASAEWIVEQAATNARTEWAVIAPTLRDVRKICFEGSSGVLSAVLPGELESYSKSDLRVRLVNGSLIRGFSADGLSRLRGYRFDGAWLDEASAYINQTRWDAVSAQVAGRILVSTTPPETCQFLDDLAELDDTIDVIGSTWENSANLSPSSLAELRRRYTETAA